MSRVARQPVTLPSGVEVNINGQDVSVEGAKGSLSWRVHKDVTVTQEDGALAVSPRNDRRETVAQAGTTRSVLSNLVRGVSEGFERRLILQGVGYRVQSQGSNLNMALGFSHPVNYVVPDGVEVEIPSQTEIVVKGIDKQRVGQVAAEIRAFRPPEPYKGKGIRYAGETVRLKEAKKK